MLRQFVLVPLLLALATALPAATVENLLQVEVAVDDQGAETREAAFRQGLATVAVRLTGRPELATSSVVRQLQENPARYVQRFQYRRGEDGLSLQVSYYGEALRKALVEAGIPIWEAARPAVLVWLAVERQGGRVIVGAGRADDARAMLEQAALRYGVPLLFPRLDAADRGGVTSSDIWGGFTDPIVKASRRYDTPLIWIGRLEQRGGGWSGRWRLIRETAGDSWQVRADTAEAAVQQAAGELAERLVADYAVLPDLDTVRSLRLHVRDVDTAERYARLERHLQALGGVTSVQLEAAAGDQMSYRLTLEVEIERVRRDLERSSLLIPVAAPASAAQGDSGRRQGVTRDELLFRLAP